MTQGRADRLPPRQTVTTRYRTRDATLTLPAARLGRPSGNRQIRRRTGMSTETSILAELFSPNRGEEFRCNRKFRDHAGRDVPSVMGAVRDIRGAGGGGSGGG